MLRWTPSGAVAAPTVLQVRVERRYSDRVRAGAPTPSRSLSDEEVASNIHYFAVEQRGPRTRPAQSLVLSGVDPAVRASLAEVVERARGWGMERVILHLTGGEPDRWADLPLVRAVDAVAVTVRRPEEAHALSGLSEHARVSAVVLLEGEGPAPALVDALAVARPARVVLTWPFPPVEAPPVWAIAERLSAAAWALHQRGVAVGIKGIPLCALGELAGFAARSGNRWYVDAEHQREEALMFFPDVVRFSRSEECRFCRAEPHCDGAPERWLRRGLLPALRAR
ncbi:MAG: hypothetical protein JXX28_14570 [Deltaproteobacteria bacterium]|nr:hypothetical protein [Deltaproteobacteria bacterium]